MFIKFFNNTKIFLNNKANIEIDLNKKYVLKDVLKGSKGQKILKYNLHEIEGYGALKDIQGEDLLIIIDYLIEQSAIVQTKSRYPVIYVSNDRDYKNLYA